MISSFYDLGTGKYNNMKLYAMLSKIKEKTIKGLQFITQKSKVISFFQFKPEISRREDIKVRKNKHTGNVFTLSDYQII